MHSLTFYVGRLRRSEINEANVLRTKRPINCLLVLAGDPFLTSFSFLLAYGSGTGSIGTSAATYKVMEPHSNSFVCCLHPANLKFLFIDHKH